MLWGDLNDIRVCHPHVMLMLIYLIVIDNKIIAIYFIY